jgi:WD40 repeat protein
MQGHQPKPAMQKAAYPRRLIDEDFLTLCQEKTNIIEQFKEELSLQKTEATENTQDDVKELSQDNHIESKEDSKEKERSEHKSMSEMTVKQAETASVTSKIQCQLFRGDPDMNNYPDLLFKESEPEEANKFMNICLTETPTMIVFSNKSFYFQADNQTALDEQRAVNKAYNDLLTNKVGNDNYINHSAQTYIKTTKNIETQTELPPKQEVIIQADLFEIDEELEKTPLSKEQQRLKDIVSQIDHELEQNVQNPFCMLPTELETITPYQRIVLDDGSQKKKASGSTKTNKFTTKKLLNTDRDRLNQNGAQKAEFENSQYNSMMNDLGDSRNNTNNGKNLNINPAVNGNNASNSRNLNSFYKPNQSTKQLSGSVGSGSDGNQSYIPMVHTNYIEKEIARFKESLKTSNANLLLSDKESRLASSESFKQSLETVEKVIAQNLKKNMFLIHNNKKQTFDDGFGTNFNAKGGFASKKFRNDLNDKDQCGSLRKLLCFKSQKTEGLHVNSLQYNPWNPLLLAAGYGNTDKVITEKNKNGLLSLWTVKNPSVPLGQLETDSPILSVKFSKSSPHLLATGNQDGFLKIYDIRKKLKTPIISSSDLEDIKHFEGILELDWVSRGQSKEDVSESIVTISSDGKLLEWSLKKTLDVTELKQITQTSKIGIASKDAAALNTQNFRYSGGFSFDFNKKDPNIYLISTGDGAIHKCSKSYKEQYIESYLSHSGPVYKVRNNPFHPEVFISCSADWSVRVWNSKYESPLFVLKSLDLFDEVLDVKWNPYCSTSFANACKDGRVEIWDLAIKNLDPIFTLPSDQKIKTCLEFSSVNPVITVGNDSGELETYRIYGYENVKYSEAEQRNNFEKIINMSLKSKEVSMGSTAQV